MSIEIKVPGLGESVSTATVARWLKKTGDAVAADEPLVELETDKVTVEVPAPAAGRLGEIVVAEGGEVSVGALLGLVVPVLRNAETLGLAELARLRTELVSRAIHGSSTPADLAGGGIALPPA